MSYFSILCRATVWKFSSIIYNHNISVFYGANLQISLGLTEVTTSTDQLYSSFSEKNKHAKKVHDVKNDESNIFLMIFLTVNLKQATRVLLPQSKAGNWKPVFMLFS